MRQQYAVAAPLGAFDVEFDDVAGAAHRGRGVMAEAVDSYLPALGIPRKLAELTQDEAVELLDLVRTLDRDKLATLVADAAGSTGA